MAATPLSVLEWLFGPGPRDGPGRLRPRWLFLRALGVIFFSAFYSLQFQIRGLIGPEGILPAGAYLQEVTQQLGGRAYWFAPTVYWLNASANAMMLVTALGLVASVLVVLNLWPRGALAVCLISYLSFVSAAQDFSSYQSDGMLLAAGFISLFFAPLGWRPRLGEEHPPSRASLFLLQWLWFTIYFESGIVKLASHDIEWRTLTALDQYYSNGPLPNWLGWYAQQLPHGFHAATALATLMIELGIVWMLFLPRRFRLICFFIVTPFQIGIILTANLAFLNHLVLILGFLLLDDGFLRRLFGRLLAKLEVREWQLAILESKLETRKSKLATGLSKLETGNLKIETGNSKIETADAKIEPLDSPLATGHLPLFFKVARHLSLVTSGFLLTWVFYVATFLLLQELVPGLPLPVEPVVALQPFRIANQYGLFAVMTRARYEIEFQGSRDGANWVAYPFRYKPQDPARPPGWYAPYQPRFDWNLWFASLGPWRASPFVIRTEELLLVNDKAVLFLFAGNPFRGEPPAEVRTVMWQYWFTDLETKRKTGRWWNRRELGLYAPALARQPDGSFAVVEWPEQILPPLEARDEP